MKQVIDNAILTREGRMITPQLVRGEYPMFVAGIYRYLHVILETQPEVPAVFIVPEEGTYSSWTTFGLLKKAPHPNAARVFLNECLTIEGQKAMADEGYIPVRDGVPLKYPQFQDPTKIKHLKPYPPPPELLMKEPATMRAVAKKLMSQ
jgi:iron(III) transport system substrate-binding protein